MKKRVLFFNRSFFGGGVERALIDLAKKLNPQKYDITIMVRNFEGEYLQAYSELERTHSNIHLRCCFDHLKAGKNLFHKIYNVLTLRIADWALLRLPSLYYRLAIKGKWDVEISYMHNEAVKIIAGSPNRKSKKYTWVHTDISAHTGWTGYFKSINERIKYYKKYDSIICVSKVVQNSVEKILGFKDNVYTIYNLNNENIVEMSKEPLNIQNDGMPVICAVGRLSFEKNFKRLINCS